MFKQVPLSLPDSIGSAFTFDFGRNSSRHKKLFLRDKMGTGKLGRSTESRSSESFPVECNGSKPNELQLRLQSQLEELSLLHQEQAKLREELASQKVIHTHTAHTHGAHIYTYTRTHTQTHIPIDQSGISITEWDEVTQ